MTNNFGKIKLGSILARLFIDEHFKKDQLLTLSPDQSHYLFHVLRAQNGAQILLFNGQDGEWLAEIQQAHKSKTTLILKSQTRAQSSDRTGEIDMWLLFSPLKKDRMDFLIEKATELGAAKLIPILTDHGDVQTVKLDRLKAQAIEAAEQSERLSVPEIVEPIKLMKLLETWPKDRALYMPIERSEPGVLLNAFDKKQKAAILIGPAGGFSEAEKNLPVKYNFVKPLNLGPRILRSETAALASLVLFQTLCGDWK